MQSGAGVTVDGQRIEVLELFKNLGSLESADGNCHNDIISRVGMANKRILPLVQIWRDRGINQELKSN